MPQIDKPSGKTWLPQGPARGTPAFDAMNDALAVLNTTFYGAFAPLWARIEDGPCPRPCPAH